MEKVGIPKETVEEIKNSIDCNLYFFGNKVSQGAMYLILAGATLLLLGVYILFYTIERKKKK